MTVIKDKVETTKKIHAELKEPLMSRFDIIKSTLGIQNDAEVIRFLIQYYYQKKVMIGKKEEIHLGGSPKEHKDIIDGIYNRLGDAIRKLGED
ncbi:MAG: hypothetical protein ACTSRI_11770 [Promethearchaeota archaeon]